MECKGCTKGIDMCYNRPCWGTPADFAKIIDAGFAKLIQCDYYYRLSEGKENIEVLTMGLHWVKDEDQESPWSLLKTLFAGMSKDRKDLDYTIEHTGGEAARLNPQGKCVMLDKDDECSLHYLDLKPTQGKKACCNIPMTEDQGNLYYANLWDTDEGRIIVDKWKKLVDYQEK